MNNLLKEFKKSVLDSLLNILWRQWSAIGVQGGSYEEERRVVDPEALLLLTLSVARHDSRLFDEVLDWMDVNGDFLNIQRLQNLQKQYAFHSMPQLSAVAEWMGRKSSVTQKWKKLSNANYLEESESLFFLAEGKPFPHQGPPDPFFNNHGLIRTPIKTRGLTKTFPSEGSSSLLLRLRALIGVNVRCEILCLLGAVDEINPSEIARRIGHHPRTTQNAMSDMVKSGFVQVRSWGREKAYSLCPGKLEGILRENGWTPWAYSAPLFKALEALWLGVSDPMKKEMDELLLSSELRQISKTMRPLLGSAGYGQPLRDDRSFPGEQYIDVFMEDTMNLITKITKHNLNDYLAK